MKDTGGNDLHELLVNDSGYNKGTICLVNRFFERGHTN